VFVLGVLSPPAGATTAHRPVTIGAHVYDVATIDPARPGTVEAFLARLQRAHDDHTLDWLANANVPTATRRAVIAYLSRPGTTTTTQTVGAAPSYGKYRCRVAVKRVESRSPGILRWYYEQRVPFCFDGHRIQSAPRPSIRTNAYLGWGYRGANVEAYWFPAPSTFKVHSRGKFVLLFGWVTIDTHRPQVDIVVRANGAASSSGTCGCA
jgi:hypothetical protein